MPPIQELISLAHPQYQQLTEEECNRWKNIAKREKDKLRADMTNVYTTSGKSVAEVIKEREEDTKIQKMMRTDIENTVQNLIAQDTLQKEKFYILDFNIYVVTEEMPREYVPAEMSVVELTLGKGITRKFHKIIKPGKIPTGYMAEAMMKSKATHKLTMNSGHATDNYIGIIIELRNFINQDEKKATYPPFYVMPEDEEKCDYILNWLYERCDDRRRFPFKIYSLPFLLHTLQSLSSKHNSGFLATCEEALEKGTFDYTSGMECQWHHDESIQDEDLQVIYCSQSKVMSKAYLFLDSCCHYYDITMIANKHCPEVPKERPFMVVAEPRHATQSLGPPEPGLRRAERRYNQSPRVGDTSTVASEAPSMDDVRSLTSQSNYSGTTQPSAWGPRRTDSGIRPCDTSTVTSEMPSMDDVESFVSQPNYANTQPSAWGPRSGASATSTHDASTGTYETALMDDVESSASQLNYTGKQPSAWGPRNPTPAKSAPDTSTGTYETARMDDVQSSESQLNYRGMQPSAWGSHSVAKTLEDDFPSLSVGEFKQTKASKPKGKTPKTKSQLTTALQGGFGRGKCLVDVELLNDMVPPVPNGGGRGLSVGRGSSAAPPGFPSEPRFSGGPSNSVWGRSVSMGRGIGSHLPVAGQLEVDQESCVSSSSTVTSIGRGSKIKQFPGK